VGIRRGDRILPRQEDQSDGEVSPRKRVFAINFPITMKVVSQDGRERTVELETSMLRDRRVISTATLDAGGQAVGYVALGRFDPVAEREFLDAIRSFRTAGVHRLVVDLRYNPGGLVHSAAGIAGAIVGERGRGRVFARVQHNSRYRDLDHVALLRVPASGGLDAEQLVVITSGASCSASELLINGLRPHLAVAVVGTTTCGKPVGSRVLESGEWAYSVMSFEVRNARGEGSYYKGIAPTCVAPDDLTHDLGDPAEASLREALHYIETGRCSGPA
jgi:C-terminal processing protease CtpA/Prc